MIVYNIGSWFAEKKISVGTPLCDFNLYLFTILVNILESSPGGFCNQFCFSNKDTLIETLTFFFKSPLGDFLNMLTGTVNVETEIIS